MRSKKYKPFNRGNKTRKAKHKGQKGGKNITTDEYLKTLGFRDNMKTILFIDINFLKNISDKNNNNNNNILQELAQKLFNMYNNYGVMIYIYNVIDSNDTSTNNLFNELCDKNTLFRLLFKGRHQKSPIHYIDINTNELPHTKMPLPNGTTSLRKFKYADTESDSDGNTESFSILYIICENNFEKMDTENLYARYIWTDKERNFENEPLSIIDKVSNGIHDLMNNNNNEWESNTNSKA